MKVLNPTKEKKEPKPKGVSRQKVAALRSLCTDVSTTIDGKTVLLKPSITAVAAKFRLKEETLTRWLDEDLEFKKKYLTDIKLDVLKDLRAMVKAVKAKVINVGDQKALEFLAKFAGIYDSKQLPGEGPVDFEDLIE